MPPLLVGTHASPTESATLHWLEGAHQRPVAQPRPPTPVSPFEHAEPVESSAAQVPLSLQKSPLAQGARPLPQAAPSVFGVSLTSTHMPPSQRAPSAQRRPSPGAHA